MGTLLTVIVVGGIRALVAHGHPLPVIAPPRLPVSASMLSLWLLAKVFDSGCTAMTGVEAVSNGVMAFREPTQKNAKCTLTIIVVIPSSSPASPCSAARTTSPPPTPAALSVMPAIKVSA